MDFQICVVCSADQPPLLPLPIEHRQLFAAIVSPIITPSDLNARCLLFCMDCQMNMLFIHHFQKMALNGVKKLKYLLWNLNHVSTTLQDDIKTKTSKQATDGYKRRVLLKTPQTTMGLFKTEPEIRSSETNTEFVSVPAPRDSHSIVIDVIGKGHTKSEPNSMQAFPVLMPYLQSDFEFQCSEFEPAKTESHHNELKPESKLKAELPQCDSEHTKDCKSAYLEQHFRMHTQNRLISKIQYIVKSANIKQADKDPNTAAETPKKFNMANISKEVIIACIKDEEHTALEQTNSTTEADAAASAVAGKKVRRRLNRKKPLKVQCPHCDKVTSKWDLRTHYHQVHAEKKPVTCNVCDKECRNSEALRIHKYTHNVRMEPKLFCVECFYQFASKSTYNKHLKSLKHTPREQYKLECEVCKKKYPIESRLRVHMDTVHRNVRKFKCKNCDKSYTENSKLRRHVRNAHEQLDRQKTYVCELCGKAFLVKKSLIDHLLVHQRLRPYKCKLCPADFSYRAGLYTHNQLKHLKKGKKKSDKNVEEN